MDVNISEQNVKPFNGIRLAAVDMNLILSTEQKPTDPPTEETSSNEFKDDNEEN